MKEGKRGNVCDTIKPFKCHICGTGFKEKINMDKHVTSVHEEVRLYQCNKCEKYFSRKYHLENHDQRIHEKIKPTLDKSQCSDCNKSFKNLNKHFKAMHEIRDHKCSHCDKICSKGIYLENHIKSVHEQMKPIGCKICFSKFSTQDMLQSHEKRVHCSKPIDAKCDQCKKTFVSYKNLQIHISNIHQNGPKLKYECDKCNKTYHSSNGLNYHNRSFHLNMKNFKCDRCNYRAVQASVVARHIKEVHLKEKAAAHDVNTRYECDICKKDFASKFHLKYHIRDHHLSKQKTFKCDVCQSEFTQKTALKIHTKTIHGGSRDHKCESCKKSYTVKSHLTHHVKTVHEGIRRYKCDKCDNTFKMNQHLKVHLLNKHNDGIRNFICNKCKKGFKSSPGLRQHRISCDTITGHFKCDYCDKILSNVELKKKHIYNCHQYVKCEICDKGFPCKQNLQIHIKTIHSSSGKS